MTETTGYINFTVRDETFRTWYKVVGDLKSSVRPLIVLHGGPGISHKYMLAHAELYTSRGIPVIFYDQIGIGQSTHLPDKPKEFWTVDFFMDELDNLISHFGIAGDFDLVGHSWGGMLAADYAATRHPRGLKHLILADSLASMELWEFCTNKLLNRFPKDFREMLRRHEREGTTDDKEYQGGMKVFYDKHVCTLDHWPENLVSSFADMETDSTVYSTMIGPSEFNVTGSLKTWSVIDKLHTITYPTLVINGANDEAQDECVAPFFQEIPKVRWVQFALSTHTPFYEEKERYFAIVGDFLTAK